MTNGPDYELQTQQLEAFERPSPFQPTRTVTTTAVTPSTITASPGQAVHLSAQVGNGDQGGYVTFSDNGSGIIGCEAVPLDLAASCDTSFSLSAPDNQIVAQYSGDALSGASASSPVDVTVQSTTLASGPPAIPGPGQVYLGAWVRPEVSHTVLAPRAAVEPGAEQPPVVQ